MLVHPCPATLPICGEIVGINELVPLANKSLTRYINFDNAASTPALQSVLDIIHNFMPYYSSVHRGTGFKSRLASEIYEEARQIVAEFVGANLSEHTVIFGKNTT